MEFKYVDGRQLGLAELEGGQSLAVTTEFSGVDTGLQLAESENGTADDVRCELITVAQAGVPEVAAAVSAAAKTLEMAKGVIPAQPGVMLPSITQGTALDSDEFSVAHGLLIAPYLWAGETPQYTEPGRLTLICQLLMLTDSEYAFALEEGVGALQAAVEEQGINLLDLRRQDS